MNASQVAADCLVVALGDLPVHRPGRRPCPTPALTEDRIRTRLDVPVLRTVFGAKQRPGRAPFEPSMQLAAVIEKPRYDLTLFKVHFGLLTLKGYTKGEHLLRFEVITHNTRQLGCGRVLDSAVRHHSLSGRHRPGTSWLSRPISVGGQAEILGISVGMLASCVVVTDEWTRIECYCDTVPRAFSDIESIGSFTLFIGRSGHSYYARPIGPLSGAAALGEFDLVIGGDCLPISPRSGPSTRCSGGWHPIRGSTFPYDQLGCQIKSYESGRLA